MKIFAEPGKENSREVIKLAVQRAKELKTDIVLPSGTGETGLLALDIAEEMDFQGKVVIVRTVSKADLGGANRMTPERKEKLLARGAAVVSTTHALSAGERGISGKYHGVYPLELMAATLRAFGQGTKVCYEVSVMALDTDNIPYGKPVVAMGGSSHGVDTAVVITPAYSANILETRIHEMLCKPGLY